MLGNDRKFLHLGAKVVLFVLLRRKIITTDQTRNNKPFKMEQ